VATENFNRAKAKFPTDQDTGVMVKQLESDLKSAQASNLIQAQNDFGVRNNGMISVTGDGTGQGGVVDSLYDSAAAGEQWQKLQQSQEIMTARVQPLRVNLPVRGQRFAFTQVLQTESGRPMTIHLFAANTKAVSWPVRGLTVAGAFLILWAVVAVISWLSLRARPV
jgi:hypothetical protein